MDVSTWNEPDRAGLQGLEQELQRDMTRLGRPADNWVLPREVAGEPVTDVVIVGGGMCGLLALFALACAGIRNVRILDRAPASQEGPWVTYARMETLRSVKALSGRAYGVGPLTFRAWYTAQFGEASWEALDKIPRTLWMDYLTWYRRVLAIPVENRVSVDHIASDGSHLRLRLSGEGACERSILARRVVLATGLDGIGRPNIPAFVDGISRSLWAHSSHEIDFASLKGKRVAVVGMGASAVDNAAEALEAGAAEVRMLVRRKEMPTVNKWKALYFYGFSAGFGELPDAWRWRLMHYAATKQTPAPRGSTLRVSRYPNAHFHLGVSIAKLSHSETGLTVHTADGATRETDFLILGTGFAIDPMSRAELAGYGDQILLWRDRYQPPADEHHPDLADFPYLRPDFSFMERSPGAAPWLSKIHCFNAGATMSLGKLSGDIPAVSEGAAFLVRALATAFFTEDVAGHYDALKAFSLPGLLGDEWTATPWPADPE